MHIPYFMCLCSLFFLSPCQASFFPEEYRAGFLKHDIKTTFNHRHERGYDINVEALWESPSFFNYIFAPRPHLGASINTHKGTDQYYLGLTWRYDFLQYLFVEGSLGGEIHDGKIKHKTRHKEALGSRFLFRESLSLGFQFLERHSLSLMLDHASNARLGYRNPGLTSFGLRYGYRLSEISGQ